MKKFILENFIFFYAEKISFFIPLLVLMRGIFIFKITSYIKRIHMIESMFFLNFILGNWIVSIRNLSAYFRNREMNNTVNVLLESKITTSNLQVLSNSFLIFFFFLVFFILW